MYNRKEVLYQVAKLYYEDNQTQSQIARSLNISRPTISTLLKEARQEGIVKIMIDNPNQDIQYLQDRIAHRYNLETVLISGVTGSDELIKHDIGDLAVSFIEGQLPKVQRLGLGWGTTVAEYVYSASHMNLNQLQILPLMGGIGVLENRFHTNHLVYTLSKKYQAQVDYFYAPAIASSLTEKEDFMSSKVIQKILAKGAECQMAVVGLGNPLSSRTYQNWRLITQEALVDLEDSGVAGDILASFFDLDGEILDTEFSRRMIGLSLEKLKQIPEVVILASGLDKASSLKTLLNHTSFKHIVIDLEIAKALLD